MSTAFERILEEYGQSVTVCSGGGTQQPTRAFLQPVEEKQGDLPTILGAVKRDRYLYLGDPAVPLDGAEFVLWLGRKFRVVTGQPIYVGDRANHWWAILAELDGEA